MTKAERRLGVATLTFEAREAAKLAKVWRRSASRPWNAPEVAKSDLVSAKAHSLKSRAFFAAARALAKCEVTK